MNVNHAAGVLKEQLIKVVIAEDPPVGKHLMEEMIFDMKRKVIPIRPNRDAPRKTYLKSPVSTTTTSQIVETAAMQWKLPLNLLTMWRHRRFYSRL